MTRIVAGAAGGLRLATPRGATTRPTSERVREALFSRLDHLGVVAGSRVLDLYAGSGALGLEALSRGATHALLVEQARPAAEVAKANARIVRAALAGDEAPTCQVRTDPVQRVLAAGPDGAAYDLVLLDPPYDLTEQALARDLTLLVDRGWLDPQALVVVERSIRSGEPVWPDRLQPCGQRAYGETSVWFAERAPDAGPDPTRH